jgi:type III secretory pathway component EscS
MSTPTVSFAEARNAFVKALTDYQDATLKLSVALTKVSSGNVSLCQSLGTIVNRTVPMLHPRH